MNYILKEDSINGIKLNERIRSQDLHEFYIIDRKDFIDELIDWISESNRDKEIMKTDLKMLMNLTCEFLFSSNETNDYIGPEDKRFEDTCKELLELNKKVNKEKFEVLSPDGYSIYRNKLYQSKFEAKVALEEWVERFKTQGYYSMSDRTKLAYDSIYNSCSIVELNE